MLLVTTSLILDFIQLHACDSPFQRLLLNELLVYPFNELLVYPVQIFSLVSCAFEQVLGSGSMALYKCNMLLLLLLLLLLH